MKVELTKEEIAVLCLACGIAADEAVCEEDVAYYSDLSKKLRSLIEKKN